MFNLPVLLGAAAILVAMRALWFSVLFKSAVKTAPDAPGTANPAVIWIATFVLGFLISMSLQFMVIHQFHVFSIFAAEPRETPPALLVEFMKSPYWTMYRSFGHGALHGVMTGLLFVAPLLGVQGLIERRGWRQIWLHIGFWVVSLALMGGLICQFA